MSERHLLHVDGLRSHHTLVGDLHALDTVNGSEGFSETVRSFYSKSKWAAGETFKALDTSFNKTTRVLLTKCGSNQQALSVLRRDVGRNGIKDGFELSAAQAGALTSAGKPEDFVGDLKILLEELTNLKKHAGEIEGYLEHLLAQIKKIESVKTSEDAVKVISACEGLNRPHWSLRYHPADGMSVSEVLPGGRVFKFEDSESGRRVKYSMSGDKPAGEAGVFAPDVNTVKTALGYIDNINDLQKHFGKTLTGYLTLIKRWGDAVKRAAAHLDGDVDVSATLKHKLDSMMDGPEDYLLFYSGFLPRVVSYTDRLIQDCIGISGKLIN